MRLSRFPSTVSPPEAIEDPIKIRLRQVLSHFNPEGIDIPPIMRTMIPMATSAILNAPTQEIVRFCGWLEKTIWYVLTGKVDENQAQETEEKEI